MTRRHQRMLAVATLLAGLGLAAAFGFQAFRQNMMYFYTPTDLLAGNVPPGAKVRLGGLVERGTFQRGDGLAVSFTLADCERQLRVRYEGILPDLFREGQGIVATGSLGADQVFTADEVLAKHDENYMPPQLAESLKTETGHSCAEFRPVTEGSGLRTGTAGPREDGATAAPVPDAARADRASGPPSGAVDSAARR